MGELRLRQADQRGRTQLDWLDSRHTFSFGDQFDPRWMGFRSLRVINEDRVEPGRGFGTHAHRNMEILTYVLAGRLRHKDSLGHEGVIGTSEIQRISAGRGITHSEFNDSQSELVRFLQIWIFPDVQDLEPGYQQAAVPSPHAGSWQCLAARETAPVSLHQDVRVLLGHVAPGRPLSQSIAAGRHGYLHLIEGAASLKTRDDEAAAEIGTGDGVAVSETDEIHLSSGSDARLLWFDLG